MKRWAFGLLVAAVFGSAAVVQDGVRTARLPDGLLRGEEQGCGALIKLRRRKSLPLCFLEGPESADRAGLECVAGSGANMSDSADVIAIEASDPSEKAVVERFGTSRAPMPLVLAVAPCGAVTKAFTAPSMNPNCGPPW